MARSLMQLAQEGKTRRFWIKDGLLITITRGNCLYVSKVGDLRKEILRECHAAGHPRRTLALIARGDYWPKRRGFRVCENLSSLSAGQGGAS